MLNRIAELEKEIEEIKKQINMIQNVVKMARHNTGYFNDPDYKPYYGVNYENEKSD